MSKSFELIFLSLFIFNVLCANTFNNNCNSNITLCADSIKDKNIGDSIHTFPNILIKNEDESILNFVSSFKDSMQLVYLIPTVYCMPMVQREISFINQTASKIGFDKVIVLTSFKTHRDFISFKRSNCPRLSCYNIVPDNFNVISPMILILNKDLVIIQGGFTQKQEPQRTIEFLQNISEYLFSAGKIKIE